MLSRIPLWPVVGVVALLVVLTNAWLWHSRQARYEMRYIRGVPCIVETVTRSLSCDWSNWSARSDG